MAESSAATAHHHGAHDESKRDFLKLIAGAGAAIGAGSFAWVLVDSMNPSKDVLALSSVEVDLTPIAEGQGIMRWPARRVGARGRRGL